MFSEFSQGGLLKPIHNGARLHMLDEADEFLYQRLAFNIVDIGRISGVNNVECIVLQLWNRPIFQTIASAHHLL
jgi:hypothetical protein